MKILVVDDDRVLIDVVSFTLRRAGFQVIQAYDGLSALETWAEIDPDLIVLDVNLPKLNGFSVCQQIRQQSTTPIILLTVRTDEEDIIRGLELGADDYISKPFSPRQLVARVRAAIRRLGLTPTPSMRKTGDFTLDPSRREFRVRDSQPIQLSPLENRFLDYLMLNEGQVLPVENIIGHLWGPEGGDRDMLRQLVHRLRSKIEVDPAHPQYIETVKGMGYSFSPGHLSE